MASYVTRRLLRSTLPQAADPPQAKPERRPKMRSRRGDKTKEKRSIAMEPDENKREGSNEDDEHDAATVGDGQDGTGTTGSLHGLELLIDVNYAKDLWAEARVLDLDVDKRQVFVHYMGWNARYDAWVRPKLIAAHGSRSKAATKKDMSWDGVHSLFEPAGASAPRKKSKRRVVRRSATPKAKSDKHKRRGSAGSAVSDDIKSVKAPTSPEVTKKRPVERSTTMEEDEGGGDAVDVAPRSSRTRASKRSERPHHALDTPVSTARDCAPSSTPSAVDTSESNGDAVCKEEETPQADTAPTTNLGKVEASRSLRYRSEKRRGRGRKGQDDASSESEYSDHDDSDVEEEDDASDEEEVRRLRKRRKQKEQGHSEGDEEDASDGASKGKGPATRRSERRAVNTKTHPLPQSVPRASTPLSGDRGATREHLAAIFRQRVYQQQLMQVTRAELQAQGPQGTEAAPVVAASPPASTAATARPRRGVGRQSSKKSAAASTAAPVVGPDPQLAAYYHYHNMMIAQAYMAADPKEIQERLRTMEQHRALQLQAYYQQLESTRARNVKSIEDTQAFMAKSASAWQKQALDAQSGATSGAHEGSSSVDSAPLKSLDDLAKSLESSKAATTGAGEDSPRDASAQELVGSKGVATSSDKSANADGGKAPSGEPDVPRGDILYEFVL